MTSPTDSQNGQLFDSVLATIGNTPVIRINNLAPKGVNLYVKFEAFNPAGSVKDRLALSIIETAERNGTLKPGQTVVEATSGNTGIGLAMVCAQKGYPLVVVMAENFSVERRRLMRFLGAKVVLTPAGEKALGMTSKARALAHEHGWFLADQFNNPANADIHATTTAVEILRDFETIGLDYWVTGAGTGGTLQGVGRVLRAQFPKTQIVVVEPDNAPMLASGLGNTGPADTHTLFRPHVMQGWSPDFLSTLLLDVRDQGLVDHYTTASGVEALETARDLARREGILAGISGGASLAGALEIAKTAPANSNILVMLPDTGERYMSTQLFDGIDADMNTDETAISQSTNGQQFGAAAPVPVAVTDDAPLDPAAVAYIHDQVTNGAHPVVLFALEWCEFCWSLRKLFAAMDLPYVSVDLDAAKSYGGPEFLGEVRRVFQRNFGTTSIPRVFVAGDHIGGATETFDAFNNASLQHRLTVLGQDFTTPQGLNAYALLPSWLHRR